MHTSTLYPACQFAHSDIQRFPITKVDGGMEGTLAMMMIVKVVVILGICW